MSVGLDNIKNFRSSNRDKLIIFFSLFLFNLVFFRFQNLVFKNDLVFSGNDFTYEIFITKLASEGNFFGISKNVGWPGGFAVWANPLFGFGPYYLSYTLGTLFSSLSIYQIYFIVLSAGISLNAVSAYWMVEKEFTNRFYPIITGLIVGISPFGLMNIGHMPVAWMFYPILFIGVAFRLSRKQINYKKALFILFISGIFSPLWWSVVVLFISLLITICYAIIWKVSKDNLKDWFFVSIGVAISIIPTLILIVLSRNYSGIGARYPWQSNVFGGRFTDAFLSSPYLNIQFSLLEKFSEGVSPEAKINSVGFVLGVCVLVGLIYVLNNEKSKVLNLPEIFYKLTIVFLLFFVSGGLGNFQAGLFVLFGQVSPARVWFRLIIILGILGFIIFLKYIASKNPSYKLLGFILFFSVFVSLIDLKYLDRIDYVSKDSLIESKPTYFLDSNTKNCPVLQVPVDTYPLMQDFLGDNGSKFNYNQMIPYTLSSNNKWSLVGTPGDKYWNNYKNLPTNINVSNIQLIQSAGFCAILFDKDFSKWQIERKAGIDFKQGQWPGLSVDLPQINFENSRYQVYLIVNY